MPCKFESRRAHQWMTSALKPLNLARYRTKRGKGSEERQRYPQVPTPTLTLWTLERSDLTTIATRSDYWQAPLSGHGRHGCLSAAGREIIPSVTTPTSPCAVDDPGDNNDCIQHRHHRPSSSTNRKVPPPLRTNPVSVK